MDHNETKGKGNQALFSIGKTADMCDVSTRTLRFYEKNGLISPDHVDEENHYRYYSHDTMRRIQAIRYLLDQGFSLSQIKETFHRSDLTSLRELFQAQISETESQINYYQQRLASLRSWCDLILEGEPVLKHHYTNISVRTIPLKHFYMTEYPQDYNGGSSEAHLETLFYTSYKQDGHSLVDMGGAFTFRYDSYEDRMSGRSCGFSLLQEAYTFRPDLDGAVTFGDFKAVCCYHIGDPADISTTYENLVSWVEDHDYHLEGTSLERHVIDFYSVESIDQYVTEILLPVKGS